MSNIDTTMPEHGDPTTQSVRDNFAVAAAEIDAATALADSKLDDAPSDGNVYARLNASWTIMPPALPLTGGTLSGGLHFGSATAPGGTSDLSRHIDLYAGTFGFSVTPARFNIVAPAASNISLTVGAQDSVYVSDTQIRLRVAAVAQPPAAADNSNTIATTAWVRSTALLLSGGTLTGPLIAAADPAAALGVATKQYVDTTAGSVASVVASHNVGRNVLNNAQFNIGQRGSGPWTTNGYNLDQWQTSFSADTMQVVRAAFSPGQMPLDEEAMNYLNVSVTGNASASAFSAYVQQIERVSRLANKKVILSFYAIAGTAGLKIGASLDQNFGTGGSPSAGVQGAGQSVTLTTGWARYSLIFNVPSIVGKTWGTNGNHYTSLILWFSSGANNATRAGNIGVQTGSFSLWGMQLEIAEPTQTQPTPLEKLRMAEDQTRCQWFFRYIPNSIIYWNPPAAQVVVNTISYGGFMRAAPSISFAPNYTNSSGIQVNGTASIDHVNVQVSSNAAGVAYVFFDMAVSAEL